MSAAERARGTVAPDFWLGRRVLITGHTGFKGSWLALWLQSLGAKVTGFSSGALGAPSLYALARVAEDMTSIEGDVRDATALLDAVNECTPEVVIHMAAQSLVRRSFSEPRETYETNVMGTVNLFDALLHTDCVRVVVNVTSDKCYENKEWEWGYREHEPMGGHDPYASSKGCSELVTTAFRRSFFSGPDAVRIASARAGNVIGGGDWAPNRLVADIMRAVLSEETLHIRNPEAVRPWQHVLCALSGYLVLAQALWSGPDHACAWNFGPADEDARPVRWIVDHVAECWPGRLRWLHDEAPHHPHEARYLKVDSSRARTHLAWQPAWRLEQGLDAVVDWYRRFRDGEDMRAVTLEQIAAYQAVLSGG